MKKNKTTKRVVAVILATLMVCAAFVSLLPLFVNAAEEDAVSYPISGYNPGEKCYSPIPLLVIMINFDADGDGVDDNPDGKYADSERVKKKTIDDKDDPMYGQPNPVFGEQWCHTTEANWTANLFSDEGNTLNTYYKYMSNDQFWWIPAKETYGEADNGIIAVTIKNVHPNCIEGSGQWVHCYKQIIEAASEYVDFSVFDVNGNGIIEKYEMCFAFVLGGAETSSGNTNLKEVFGFHAYYKDYDMNNVCTTDGVEIGRSGFFGTGAISGGGALRFGVFAHELGHYLGAPDLYDTNGSEYDTAVGSPSMMASGSHGSTPSHFDPYMLSEFGFYATDTIRQDGTYTLYSKSSSQGKYNIIKLATPNPKEYFLIENRFNSKKNGTGFDNGISSGVLIWHIDENIHSKTGMTCNTASKGYDPAVVVYSPISKAGNIVSALSMYGAFRNNHPTSPNYAMFDPTAYTFPKSETWYTSLTAEEAKQVENLRVEIVSAPGDETQIKITGAYNQQLPPEFTMFAYDWTQSSVTIKGELKTLNYSTLTNATFTLTDIGTGKVAKETQVKLNSDYTYEILCDGLDAGREYEFKIVAESSHGESVAKNTCFTKPEEIKRVTVTMVINSDHYGTTTQTLNVGSSLKNREFTKAGYIFDGWYLDEEYTKPYTIGPVETEEDFTIYAKWTKDTTQTTPPPVSTTQKTEPPANTTAPVQGGGNEGGGNTTVIVIAAVAAVVLVGGGAGVAVVMSKKKK